MSTAGPAIGLRIAFATDRQEPVLRCGHGNFARASLFADCARFARGFRRAVRFDIDSRGRFAARDAGGFGRRAEQLRRPGAAGTCGLALACTFQRALAGLAERSSADAPAADSFWTWRQVMYRFWRPYARDTQTIATVLYRGCATATPPSPSSTISTHAPDGQALRRAGRCRYAHRGGRTPPASRLTLLPVLSMRTAFGGGRAATGQRRFPHTATTPAAGQRKAAPAPARQPPSSASVSRRTARGHAPELRRYRRHARDNAWTPRPIHHIAEREAEGESLSCIHRHPAGALAAR